MPNTHHRCSGGNRRDDHVGDAHDVDDEMTTTMMMMVMVLMIMLMPVGRFCAISWQMDQQHDVRGMTTIGI